MADGYVSKGGIIGLTITGVVVFVLVVMLVCWAAQQNQRHPESVDEPSHDSVRLQPKDDGRASSGDRLSQPWGPSGSNLSSPRGCYVQPNPLVYPPIYPQAPPMRPHPPSRTPSAAQGSRRRERSWDRNHRPPSRRRRTEPPITPPRPRSSSSRQGSSIRPEESASAVRREPPPRSPPSAPDSVVSPSHSVSSEQREPPLHLNEDPNEDLFRRALIIEAERLRHARQARTSPPRTAKNGRGSDHTSPSRRPQLTPQGSSSEWSTITKSYTRTERSNIRRVGPSTSARTNSTVRTARAGSAPPENAAPPTRANAAQRMNQRGGRSVYGNNRGSEGVRRGDGTGAGRGAGAVRAAVRRPSNNHRHPSVEDAHGSDLS